MKDIWTSENISRRLYIEIAPFIRGKTVRWWVERVEDKYVLCQDFGSKEPITIPLYLNIAEQNGRLMLITERDDCTLYKKGTRVVCTYREHRVEGVVSGWYVTGDADPILGYVVTTDEGMVYQFAREYVSTVKGASA